MGPRLMATGMSFVEMGSVSRRTGQRGSFALLSAEDTRSVQWQGHSTKIILTSMLHCKLNSSVCVSVCVLFYFSSRELKVSSQGLWKGLIYAQDLGLRLTLEEGLS